MPGIGTIPTNPDATSVYAGGHKYALGAVKPYVREAAYVVGNKFNVKTIYGVGIRPNPSDHMAGLALDFMVYGDSAKGSAIASYIQSNAGALHVQYIIWQQRIWNVDRSQEGWRGMEDRGSPTANHRDHVHVSFKSVGGNSIGNLVDNLTPDAITDPVTKALGPVMGVVDAVKWLTDQHNLLRVASFIGGGVLLLVALLGWAAVSTGIASTASKLKGTA